MMAMVNEAARVLEDKVVGRAGDVDLAMIMGTGFPPFRGGLLRFADALAPGSCATNLQELAEVVGARFEPAPLVIELAAEQRTFYEAFA